tara:strand:+ start:327 stop:746 length:420 start_codon:yes stop_codon:yes gene_type:complete
MKVYKELYRVASKYYPQEGGWCTVIALAVTANIGFGKARSIMFNTQQRINGKGSSVTRLNRAVKAQGFNVEQRDRMDKRFGRTLKTMQDKLAGTKGTYLIYTKQHVTVIKDGVCEDWCNNEHGRVTLYRIESIYEVTPV